MTEKMLKKRKYLKELSETAVKMAEGTEEEETTVNNKLMKFIHNPDGVLEFRSFKKWKAEGFTVKKGSKAFLLWGQPLENSIQKIQEGTNEELEEETEESKFFPVAYVFSSEQVRKIEKKEPAKA